MLAAIIDATYKIENTGRALLCVARPVIRDNKTQGCCVGAYYLCESENESDVAKVLDWLAGLAEVRQMEREQLKQKEQGPAHGRPVTGPAPRFTFANVIADGHKALRNGARKHNPQVTVLRDFYHVMSGFTSPKNNGRFKHKVRNFEAMKKHLRHLHEAKTEAMFKQMAEIMRKEWLRREEDDVCAWFFAEYMGNDDKWYISARYVQTR